MKARLDVRALPYRALVYINNQVLIPASLVKALGIENARYANITIRYNGFTIEVKGAKPLRTRHTASRQFTIPKHVRGRYGIGPLDEVEVVSIEPVG